MEVIKHVGKLIKSHGRPVLNGLSGNKQFLNNFNQSVAPVRQKSTAFLKNGICALAVKQDGVQTVFERKKPVRRCFQTGTQKIEEDEKLAANNQTLGKLF